ncbi:outer membrane beta-barrel protein [Alteromonas sp. 5E99-2]|uniref:outer membrane beta-barrel protein n=1 Tax=Alteromonas sp. 5E99-2 TaxID=2817683 RepID=UPI001A992F70|nr:outer membrane beta-barrel protein [Alteromonas sp. 5E99-2]MBO1257133.1 outer membrane beta-barrel protein [Alteromonas sp. 5E99-2]
MKGRLFTIYITIVFGCLATSVSAKDSNGISKGFYLGANISSLDAELDISELTFEATAETSDIATSVFVGYQFSFNNDFRLDTDIEYRTFNSIESDQLLVSDGKAYFLNFRPKYVVSKNYGEYYLSLTLGFGEMDIDYTLEGTTDTVSQSEFASQLGIEYGIILNSGIGLGIGYQVISTEQDNAEFTFDGVYGSIRYQF